MNIKSLHEVLGIRYIDTHITLVVVEKPSLKYIDAREIIKNTQANYTLRDSDLSILTKDRHGITTITKFIDGMNVEFLRGTQVSKIYIDTNHPEYKKARANVAIYCSNIIEKT